MANSKTERPGIADNKEIKGQLPLTVFLDDPRAKDVSLTGGKGASLAELSELVPVPPGFVATTALCDRLLEQHPEITEKIDRLDQFSVSWLKAKLAKNDEGDSRAGVFEAQIRDCGAVLEEQFKSIGFSPEIKDEIARPYNRLSERVEKKEAETAVRSSCPLEDGADFSFAGQYGTELHQVGEEEVVGTSMKCLASQFGARVIMYRNIARLGVSGQALVKNGGDIEDAIKTSESFSHSKSKLAVVVQEMVNASNSVSGVVFSRNSNTNANKICVNVSYGLGESIVSGKVTPDFYEVDPRTFEITGRRLGEKATKTVYAKKGTMTVEVPEADRKKFCRTDAQIIEIAKAAKIIGDHYGDPRDIEFAFDASDKLFFTQARPDAALLKKFGEKDPMIVEIRERIIPEKVAEEAVVILQAGSTGCPGVATGEILFAENVEHVLSVIEAEENKGKKFIMVAEMTDPDWMPAMKKVTGIITQVGGENCHAAIVGRELGIPTIIGAGDKIKFLKGNSGKEVTLDASDHKIYEGILSTEEVGDDADVREIKKNPTDTVIKINMAMPDEAGKLHAFAELGDKFGIGLLRIEFLLSEIGVHVNALVDFDKGNIDPNSELYKRIADKIAGFKSGKDYFITKLSEGIASEASNFPDSDVAVRTTDFKTNEYANLIGGKEYESVIERNPMIGKRGTGRAISPECREGTMWELEAIKKAREKGNKKIKIMFPMVRTPDELTGSPLVHSKPGYKGIFEIMKEVGLERGKDGLKVGMMVEVPSNVLQIDKFLDTGIDFVSFGSNDLTQLILGVDRDSQELAQIPWYNEENPAVMDAIDSVIDACNRRGVETGICGNGPSNRPNMVKRLVARGITSISVTKDRYMATYRLVREAEEEKRKLKEQGIGETILYTAPSEVGGNGNGEPHGN